MCLGWGDRKSIIDTSYNIRYGRSYGKKTKREWVVWMCAYVSFKQDDLGRLLWRHSLSRFINALQSVMILSGRKVFQADSANITCSFFSFLCYPCTIWKFPGKGLWPTPQSQPHRIRAAFVTYAEACGNAQSLAHWARPGIEPTSS